MKTLLYLLISLTLLACNDDDKTENPIDQLPPLTNTGENTFGCLIDGRAFTPRGGGLGGPSRGASYQYVPNANLPNPIWVFQVFARNLDTYEGVSINLGFLNFEDLNAGKYDLSIVNTEGIGGGHLPITC